MNKFKEFIKINKKDILWMIPIYLLGVLIIGTKQNSLESGIYWLSIIGGMFLSLIFGFFLTIFVGDKNEYTINS
jgi:phosphotransferase system  glucose/maltose/N-acetylglucosamine-specific IIC component